jgi:hypothetical protein
MSFKPVTTLAELDSLDLDDMVAGHMSAERGDPEPGENRGRAFWHGWRTRMMDLGEIETPLEHKVLVHMVVDRMRWEKRRK